jgi:hypothetical protein
MSQYVLNEVVSQKDKREFIGFAKELYRNDPNWVQPLDSDIDSVFDPTKNALFADGEAIRWVVKDSQGKICGRIAAFYSRHQAEANEQPTGGCGFFESIDNQQVADMLFDASRDWLMQRGMQAMDGPINFGDRNFWWGLLVEGFSQPMYCQNYNPLYYKDLFEKYGFKNYFEQYDYLRELVPDKLNSSTYDRAKRIMETPGYEFTTLKLNQLDKFAEDFRQIYNKGWAKFNGVNPISSEHARKLITTLKPIIDPNVAYFAYYEGDPIGFFISIPDLNRLIVDFNGKFGLLNKLKMLWRLKKTRMSNRLWGLIFGIVPEHQGKGVESGLIYMIEQLTMTGKSKYKTLEISWIGDFNPVMMRMIETFVNAKKMRTHVTYRYLFDREKEFTRAPKLWRKRTPKPATQE